MKKRLTSALYYQELHDKHDAFQQNNWLLSELEILRQLGGESLLELGCGNGLFLEKATNYWSHVEGIDWALSPVLKDVQQREPGVRFVQADICSYVSRMYFDLVVSADFLEHLSPEVLLRVIKQSHEFGRINFHKIACYDDGHSHLSIFHPLHWLGLFNEAVPGGMYRLISEKPRKNNPKNLVIVIANYDPCVYPE